MSDELKTAVEDLASAWEGELKPRIDQMEQESKTAGEASAETKAAVDRVQDRLDDLEVKLQKAATEPRYDDEMSQGRKDFVQFTRTGSVPAESKVMTLADESLGGILAPPDFIAEVIKGIVQYSPVRQYVRVRRTSRQSIKIPKRTGLAAAAWTGETATRPETTNPTWGMEEIPNHEMYARIIISNWDLEDPEVNLEADARDQMAEQFGVTEGAAFVNGDGNAKPQGFLQTGGGIGLVNNGATSFTNGDGLIRVKFELKEQYWAAARWFLNRFSLRDVRLLKDTTNNYLWSPGLGPGGGLTDGLVPTIVDCPYTIVKDMPDVASASLSVAIGDWNRCYTAVDRVEIQYLRDPYTQASTGAVVFHARKRVGGQVVLPEAAKILRMSA